MPTADGKRLREKIVEGAEKVEEDEMGQNEWEVVRLSTLTSSLMARQQMPLFRLCSLTQVNSVS